MIDTEYAFIWNEMGQYLRRSAVASLAWNFGGFIIPGVSGSSTPLESVPGENNDRDGAVLAALLNKTVVESEWARVEEDQNEYGDENGDEPQVEEVENTPGLYWRGMAR